MLRDAVQRVERAGRRVRRPLLETVSLAGTLLALPARYPVRAAHECIAHRQRDGCLHIPRVSTYLFTSKSKF